MRHGDIENLSDTDWAEIYYAVLDKENQLRREGPILQSKEELRAFVRHLRKIRQALEAAFARAGITY